MAVVDRSGVPAIVTMTNNSSRTISVPLYRVSGFHAEIKSGDSLKLTVNSSYELIYYVDTVKVEGLVVTSASVEA